MLSHLEEHPSGIWQLVLTIIKPETEAMQSVLNSPSVIVVKRSMDDLPERYATRGTHLGESEYNLTERRVPLFRGAPPFSTFDDIPITVVP